MSLGSRMKERRESLGITQVQLAELLGVTKGAIGNYETDANSPKSSILYKIFEALNCDANYLFQDEIRERGEYTASPQEMEHLVKKYRLLDPEWKEAVDNIVAIGYRAYEQRQARLRARHGDPAPRPARQARPEAGLGGPPRLVEKLIYLNPAAAGTPLYAESDFERWAFPEDQVPKNADFGIRISGKSMEPTVQDGAIVWVHKALELVNGAVGVFMINDSAVCKRFFRDPDGAIRLESDNPGFGPVQLLETDTFLIVGEVVGVSGQI